MRSSQATGEPSAASASSASTPAVTNARRKLRKAVARRRAAALGAALMWRSLGGFESDDFEAGEMPSEAELRAAFDMIDIDQNGQISEQELLAAIKRGFGESSETDEAVAAMITAADADGDGLIDFGEYCQVLRGA